MCLLESRELSQLLHCHFSMSSKLIKTKDDNAMHSCAWRNSSHQVEIINNAIVVKKHKLHPVQGNWAKLTHRTAILCLVFRMRRISNEEFLRKHLYLNGNPSSANIPNGLGQAPTVHLCISQLILLCQIVLLSLY